MLSTWEKKSENAVAAGGVQKKVEIFQKIDHVYMNICYLPSDIVSTNLLVAICEMKQMGMWSGWVSLTSVQWVSVVWQEIIYELQMSIGSYVIDIAR